ncbi:(2Fe-2S) ferredoxin domain-containing protein [Bacillus sp. CMF21]|uniref:(2Fe-2S) ferredoxin domain-containing protein n=1 Tax=Metabacillus dongyingensis TaxID=2874282 RepID=UPI001CBE4492|nr:(2Fe-2S) ferredoxin domain-containing protein [Metabacillus dongyingensis]UAL53537.1 (2Fe-2S) ferredoxin domain-containing protein [Metabacillus dongyingensis]UOK59003.1 (2Fe-2S) ferredoxin domain-containing protein [Bacillus sp. OVS6]USK29847.1 (2Fe-2S) ferredoxin domain-containing protein [Bacillus sp. CMF21]
MNLDGFSKHLLICSGKTCTKNGAEEVTETIRGELKNLELQKEIHTTKTLCNGQCKHGPIAVLYPQGIWYKEMNKTKSEELIRQLKENNNDHIGSELYCHDGKTFKNHESSER